VSAAVEVNEAKVFATRTAADWWVLFRMQAERASRIKVVTASIGGDRLLVACDDAAHAQELVALFVEKGLPKSAVKVARKRSTGR
jgi:hypothetical protein